jgi:DNA-binding beta-propeller fold protein YncE
MRPRIAIPLLLMLVWPCAVAAELVLPPGFTASVYVTGEGFDTRAAASGRGMPAVSTLAFDDAGSLYLARTGRRYTGGDVEDIWPVYRIPLGGARLTPKSEASFFYGPPLRNPQVGAVGNGRDLFVTTFDRDRQIGVLYRIADGRIEMVAGGTPAKGTPPLLRQPEGVVVDGAGNLLVADRNQGVVIKLDPAGRVLDPRHVAVARPRVLALDGAGRLWIGSDGKAEAPWQPGPGEIWMRSPEGEPRMVLQGPVPQAIGVSAGGNLFVADRHGAQVFAVTPEGTKVEFARFTDGDTTRGLGFAPATLRTREAGLAGDLFLVTIRRGAWPVNEVIRISGPFDELVRQRHAR